MRRRVSSANRARVAAGAALVALAACSLESSVKDACNDAADCNAGRVCNAGRCAPPEAITSEGGAVLRDGADGGSVAIPINELPAHPTFCDNVAPPTIYCADFDRGPLTDAWDNRNRTPDIGASGGGTILPETEGVPSPPYAAALSLPALVDKTATAGGYLVRSLHSAPADMTIELELRIVTEYFPVDKFVPLMMIDYGVAKVFVARRSTGTWLSVGRDVALSLTQAIPVGVWTTLSISLRNRPVDGGTDGEIRVRVNHRDAAFARLPAAWQVLTEQKLMVGPLAEGPLGVFRMNVDNVRIWDRADL